ncbi:MAG: hypothetical protein U5P41_08215 [Gammaproteobacteria bacterium]|nr:hypothetical protein [Gammaproteobacteria bacterium]
MVEAETAGAETEAEAATGETPAAKAEPDKADKGKDKKARRQGVDEPQ